MCELIKSTINNTAADWEKTNGKPKKGDLLFVLKVMKNLEQLGIDPKQQPHQVQNAINGYFDNA